MEYHGKLYGKVGGITFDTGKTTEDWDAMEKRIAQLEAENQALSMSGVMAKLPTTILFEKVTRVEVIDQNGRSYKNPKPAYNVEIQLQDDERTLKVFIGN